MVNQTTSQDDQKDLLIPKGDEKPQEELLSVDHFISKIGLGKYHYTVYAIAAFYYFGHGAVITAIALINDLLQAQYNYTFNQLLLSEIIFFTGCAIGGMMAGFVTDWIGRKLSYTIAMGLF